MIVFDLKCASGHVFEAWFASTADWEDQRQRKLVSCPLCNDGSIEKAVMSPAVGAKGNRGSEPGANAGRAVAMSSGENPARVKAMLAAMARAQADLIRDADYVGKRFAEEARGMHLGEVDQRQIYGETTAEEARALLDEGVPVAPLLLPVRPRGSNA